MRSVHHKRERQAVAAACLSIGIQSAVETGACFCVTDALPQEQAKALVFERFSESISGLNRLRPHPTGSGDAHMHKRVTATTTHADGG